MRNDQWETVSFIASATGAELGDGNSDAASVRDFETDIGDGVSAYSYDDESRAEVAHIETIEVGR